VNANEIGLVEFGGLKSLQKLVIKTLQDHDEPLSLVLPYSLKNLELENISLRSIPFD